MPIEGFLEAVEHFQVRGWVYDTERPRTQMTVEILLRDKSLGTTGANLYRPDLEQGGIGTGCHAFVLYFPHKIDKAEFSNVSARVQAGDNSYYTLRRLLEPPAPKSMLSFCGASLDDQQAPVFVLGAARSGTTIMVQSLLKTGRYKGHWEGHVLDLLQPLATAVNNFYERKRHESAVAGDNMISFVPQEYFDRAIDQIFVKIIQGLQSQVRWVEKTPNSDMISLAPRFRRIWPKSRFIFMKRRFLEYSQSRSRKFAGSTFSESCEEWKRSMATWAIVRPKLEGVGLELDQHYLSAAPDAVAASIKEFLDLTEVEASNLTQAFRHDRPEQTTNPTEVSDLDHMQWTESQIDEFKRICLEWMGAFGYSSDATYFKPGSEHQQLVLI